MYLESGVKGMYLEIYQYDPSDFKQVEFVQREVRDFNNYHPRFYILKTESIVLNDIVTIQIWYKEKECI